MSAATVAAVAANCQKLGREDTESGPWIQVRQLSEVHRVAMTSLDLIDVRAGHPLGKGRPAPVGTENDLVAHCPILMRSRFAALDLVAKENLLNTTLTCAESVLR